MRTLLRQCCKRMHQYGNLSCRYHTLTHQYRTLLHQTNIVPHTNIQYRILTPVLQHVQAVVTTTTTTPPADDSAADKASPGHSLYTPLIVQLRHTVDWKGGAQPRFTFN